MNKNKTKLLKLLIFFLECKDNKTIDGVLEIIINA